MAKYDEDKLQKIIKKLEDELSKVRNEFLEKGGEFPNKSNMKEIDRERIQNIKDVLND